MILVFIYQHIFILCIANLMKIYFVEFVLVRQFTSTFWSIISAIIEAISFPCDIREFYPFDLIGQFFPAFDLHSIDLTPVTSRSVNAVGKVFPVLAYTQATKRGGTIS